MRRTIFLISVLSLAAVSTATPSKAQRTLTLEECRRMALETDAGLQQARIKVEMAGIDRKTALANYFPNVSAAGAYLHNHDGVSLVSPDASAMLTNAGTLTQSKLQEFSGALMEAVMANPMAAMEYSKSPMWQTFLGALSKADVSQTIGALGQEIDAALHPDLQNILAGAVSVRQPLYTGGKILSANRIAKLAEELSVTAYDQIQQEVVVSVDQAYWQIVSIAAKKKLAEAYSDLLQKMVRDAELAVKEGVSTESDVLQVKVKANEARMLETKASNGLDLAKMLLCKQVGIELDSDIVLADEALDELPIPQVGPRKDLELVLADRPETKSLEIATRLFNEKISFARADQLPKVALTANYIITNPSLKTGLSQEFAGFLTAGVALEVPIFHGFEARRKTRKAKAEVGLYQSQLDDAKNLIALQVSQLRKRHEETIEKMEMTMSNLECAEENLRAASVGFEEGIVTAQTALAAQTAWLQANSERIDAATELQMLSSNLRKAEAAPLPIL